MEEGQKSAEALKVDVEQVLYSKNPAMKKVIPGFLISYLKRIVHQDEINEFLSKAGHLKNAEFIAEGLREFDISYRVTGSENLPEQGRYIFVSNHPWEVSTDWFSFMSFHVTILT